MKSFPSESVFAGDASLFFSDAFILLSFEPWFFGPQSCLNICDRPIWLFIRFVIERIRKAHMVSGTSAGGLRAAVATTAVVGHFTFLLFCARICGWPFESLTQEWSADCCIAFTSDDICHAHQFSHSLSVFCAQEHHLCLHHSHCAPCSRHTHKCVRDGPGFGLTFVFAPISRSF